VFKKNPPSSPTSQYSGVVTTSKYSGQKHNNQWVKFGISVIFFTATICCAVFGLLVLFKPEFKNAGIATLNVSKWIYLIPSSVLLNLYLVVSKSDKLHFINKIVP